MVTAPSVGIYPHQSQQGHLFLYFSVPMAGGLPRWLSNKEPACQYRRHSSMPGSGRSPGGGHDYPLQSSCPENPMDRGAWWATVHRVAKSQTWQGVHSDGWHPSVRKIGGRQHTILPRHPCRWLSRRDPAQPPFLGLRSKPSWRLLPSLLFPAQSSLLPDWPPVSVAHSFPRAPGKRCVVAEFQTWWVSK